MLLIRLRLRLLGAVCCFVSAVPVRVGCFLPLSAALGLASVIRSVLLVHARGPAPRLGLCLLGFPAVVCAATPVPALASLCNKSSLDVRM